MNTLEDYREMFARMSSWPFRVIIWAYLERIRLVFELRGEEPNLEGESFFLRVITGDVKIGEEQLKGMHPDRMNLVHYTKLAELMLAKKDYPKPDDYPSQQAYLEHAFVYEWTHDESTADAGCSEAPLEMLRPLPGPE